MDKTEERGTCLGRSKNQRVPDAVVTTAAVVLAVYHLLWVSTLFPRLGLYFQTQQHRALSLGLFLLLTFLVKPAGGAESKGRLPWYDYLFILASVLPTGYYALYYSRVQEHWMLISATGLEMAFAALLVLAVLEAGRRMLGYALPVIVVFFIVHALFTNHFPGIFFGREVGLVQLTGDVYLGLEGIFGYPIWIAGTTVITFILFSQLLIESGADQFFLNLALSMVGRFRGGPAKVAVIASSFFATLSGSPTANVVATGSITIPLMKNVGYPPYFAAAVEAVASKGGQLTPPIMGAVIFLMVEATGVTYLEVAIAAALPAFLYYLSIFMQVDNRAARTGLKGLSRKELPSFKQTMKEGWQYLLPLVSLVCLIAYQRHSPEMAALYSMALLWIVCLFRKKSRLGPRRIISAFKTGSITTLYAAIPCALSGIILASLATTGLGLRFSGQVINLAGGNLAILLCLAALASFVLGMGMTSIAIYIILSVLIAPSLVNMGVNVLAAHLFIIFWGNLSFITPPVAIAAFAAAGIAGADPMKTGWQASRLGIVSYFIPFMFVLNPTLLLIGHPAKVLLTAVTATVGVILLAGGVEGYCLGRIKEIPRLVLLLGALLLVYPGWQTDILGLALALPVLLWCKKREMRETRMMTAQADDATCR